MTADEQLAAIESAIRDYHLALDDRRHAGVSGLVALSAICDVMDMFWRQGAETKRRRELALDERVAQAQGLDMGY